LFQDVEKLGGMTAALRAGMPQAAVAKSAGATADGVAKRRIGIIGTNLFPNLKEKPLATPDFGLAELHARRGELISSYRSRPQQIQHARVMERLGNLAQTDDARRLAAVAEAFDLGATLGEVSYALRRAHAKEPALASVPVRRRAAGFEKLRRAAGAFKARTGAGAKVWLANFGPAKQYKARADFSAGFFSVGGFEIAQAKGVATPDEAVAAALKSGAQIVVLCSSDDSYPALVPPVVQALKAAKPDLFVVLAGYPEAQIEAHKAAGVDDFIHIRANCLAFLESLQKRLGIAG
jgi:methylmalonyl-CoA mutase